MSRDVAVIHRRRRADFGQCEEVVSFFIGLFCEEKGPFWLFGRPQPLKKPKKSKGSFLKKKHTVQPSLSTVGTLNRKIEFRGQLRLDLYFCTILEQEARSLGQGENVHNSKSRIITNMVNFGTREFSEFLFGTKFKMDQSNLGITTNFGTKFK